MSGTEAFLAIQLIGACINIADAITGIADAVHDASGLPPKLRFLLEKLPAIKELLSHAQTTFRNGLVAEATSKIAAPNLRQCEQALGELQGILEKHCPEDGDNLGRRFWKGAKTVLFDGGGKVQRLLKTVQESLELLEQKEICVIGTKLDELREATEALGRDEGDRYVHNGGGNIMAGSGQTNYVQHGKHARQVITHARPETPPIPSSNLHFRSDPAFIERAALTDQIRLKLSVPTNRVALFGLGGVGKSRLAIEFVRELRQHSPQTWVLWIHASSAPRFNQSVREIVDFLKIPGRANANANMLQLLRSSLLDQRKGRWLIVLDSADEVDYLTKLSTASDQSQLTSSRIDYFPTCDHGSMLITTRSEHEALKLVFENDTIFVPPMSEHEAEALLNKKLGRSDPRDRQLALALDCMPLAIIQAAAFIGKRGSRCSVKQYLDHIEQSRNSRSGLLQKETLASGRDPEASNSILLTWQTSFEHIRLTNASAADLLSFMSFCDPTSIPEIILRAGNDEIQSTFGCELPDFEEDVITLRDFSFISELDAGKAWEMHRLVQDATQIWLRSIGGFDKIHGLFVYRLYVAFPRGTFENWQMCHALYPHAKSASEEKPADQDVLLLWSGIMFNSAWYASLQGNHHDALALAATSKEARTACLGEEHLLTLESSEGMVIAYQKMGRLAEAEQLGSEVMNGKVRLLGPEDIATLSSACILASIYDELGRWDVAVQLYSNSLEISRRMHGAEHQITLCTASALASMFVEQRQREAAERLYPLVLDRTEADPPEHSDALTVLSNSRSQHGRMEHWQEPEKLQREVLETNIRTLGKNHPETLTAMHNLASALADREKWSEAQAVQMKVLEATKNKYGERSAHLIQTMSTLAHSFWMQGDLDEAEKLQVQAMEISVENFGSDHPGTWNIMNNLCGTYSSQGRLSEAEKLQSKALAGLLKYNADHGLQHPITQRVKANLAAIQRRRRKRRAPEDSLSGLSTRTVEGVDAESEQSTSSMAEREH